jgi:hypothetical protein
MGSVRNTFGIAILCIDPAPMKYDCLATLKQYRLAIHNLATTIQCQGAAKKAVFANGRVNGHTGAEGTCTVACWLSPDMTGSVSTRGWQIRPQGQVDHEAEHKDFLAVPPPGDGAGPKRTQRDAAVGRVPRRPETNERQTGKHP